MSDETAVASASAGHFHEHWTDNAAYLAWIGRMEQRLHRLTNNGAEPLFQTNAEGLFSADYLGRIARMGGEPALKYHTCSCCRRFFDAYADLAVVDGMGNVTSALWDPDDAPDFYKPAAEALATSIKRARITGVFYSDARMWGQPVTGIWSHFAVQPPLAALWKDSTREPHVGMASKREDLIALKRAIRDYPADVAGRALALVKAESLYRSEKVLGVAEWFHNLHTAMKIAHPHNREALLWYAVAKAPAGFCHVRSTMIGTLLDDIVSGFQFEDIARRFASKMNVTQYQRPSAELKQGHITHAERVVAELGIARSLERRYATLEDIVALWRPPVASAAPAHEGGIFAHLKPGAGKQLPDVKIPQTAMSWAKFRRDVLPQAKEIYCRVTSGRHNLCQLLTAVHHDAPPILQWDSADQRNPVNWYSYVERVSTGAMLFGSFPERFGLQPNQWHEVQAVTLMPHQWHDETKFANHANGVIFVLSGARDMDAKSLALFPETLIAPLHEIRATIEAHSNSKAPAGTAEGSAAGLYAQAGGKWGIPVRVVTDQLTADYLIDRWE